MGEETCSNCGRLMFGDLCGPCESDYYRKEEDYCPYCKRELTEELCEYCSS
jgi:predicted amidophosphoribosyltransferase